MLVWTEPRGMYQHCYKRYTMVYRISRPRPRFTKIDLVSIGWLYIPRTPTTWRFPEMGVPLKSSILDGFFHEINQPFGAPP